MKKLFSLTLLIVTFSLVILTPRITYAADATTYTWQHKFKRGFLNAVTFLVEIPQSIQQTSSEKNLFAGWTVGIFRGVGESAARLTAGLLDMITCPFEVPVPGKAPLIDPEYVWQKPGVVS